MQSSCLIGSRDARAQNGTLREQFGERCVNCDATLKACFVPAEWSLDACGGPAEYKFIQSCAEHEKTITQCRAERHRFDLCRAAVRVGLWFCVAVRRLRRLQTQPRENEGVSYFQWRGAAEAGRGTALFRGGRRSVGQVGAFGVG